MEYISKNYIEKLLGEVSVPILDKYLMSIVENSLINKNEFRKYRYKKGEFLNKRWGYIINIVLTLKEIKKFQKLIVNHFEDPSPWYMYGYNIKNKNELIVAFGSDDGNNGKIFIFDRKDKRSCNELKKYGLSKDIPEEELDIC